MQITNKQNNAHIIMALILMIASAVFLVFCFSACKPIQVRCNEAGYYQKVDTTTTKTDTVREPYIVILPGDTVFLSGKITKPCPDSLKQWVLFTSQINAILNQNKKYKQTIDFERNTFTYTLKTANDSMIFYREIIRQLTLNIETQLKPIAVPYAKIPAWCWWVMGLSLSYFLVTIAIKILKK